MWFLPESHLPRPEKTYGGKLVWRMSDGRRNNWKNIVWRLAIVSEIFFGQSVAVSYTHLSSMGAVVEQIQQTYDLQVNGYYSQLHLLEDSLIQEEVRSIRCV